MTSSDGLYLPIENYGFTPGQTSSMDCTPRNGHYRDMPAGLRGKVIHVDDTGTVHVSWENGSSLGAVHGFDRIRRVD